MFLALTAFLIFMSSNFIIHNNVFHHFIIWIRRHASKPQVLQLDVHLKDFLLVNIVRTGKKKRKKGLKKGKKRHLLKPVKSFMNVSVYEFWIDL